MSGVPPPRGSLPQDDEGGCHLISENYAYALQLILGFAALAGLVVREREEEDGSLLLYKLSNVGRIFSCSLCWLVVFCFSLPPPGGVCRPPHASAVLISDEISTSLVNPRPVYPPSNLKWSVLAIQQYISSYYCCTDAWCQCRECLSCLLPAPAVLRVLFAPHQRSCFRALFQQHIRVTSRDVRILLCTYLRVSYSCSHRYEYILASHSLVHMGKCWTCWLVSSASCWAA